MSADREAEAAALQALLEMHLTEGLQTLQAEGVEVVILAGRTVAQSPQGVVAIVGTVRSPAEVLALLVQATREMMPGIRIELPKRPPDRPAGS